MWHVKVFIFNPLNENTYLVFNDNRECIVVDPGCYYGEERDAVAGFISEYQLKPVLLMNTHCHLDHIFGNLFISESYGLDLRIHPLEKPILDFSPAAGLMWNLPFDQYTGKILDLEPGKTIQSGNDFLEVRFTPGHSPGSVSFYAREEGFVISGDVLFRESIGRTDLPGGNFDQLANSIRTRLYNLPDMTKVYSGHGPVTTIGHEKKHNPFVREA